MNNALKYVKILEGAGITRDQAEAQVQMVLEIVEGNLATKQDVKNLETKLDSSIEHVEAKIDRLEVKLDTSVERLEHKLLQSEYRLTIKLGTIVTVVIAAATTVIKLL